MEKWLAFQVKIPVLVGIAVRMLMIGSRISEKVIL
jgi:hypothetical protein